jgi:hypothetical protein
VEARSSFVVDGGVLVPSNPARGAGRFGRAAQSLLVDVR